MDGKARQGGKDCGFWTGQWRFLLREDGVGVTVMYVQG